MKTLRKSAVQFSSSEGEKVAAQVKQEKQSLSNNAWQQLAMGERQADLASEQVMAGQKVSKVSPLSPECQSASQFSSSFGNGRESTKGLPVSTQGRMEKAFGEDFSNVRLHTNQASESLNAKLNAKAFTFGQDIYFARGAYQPGSAEGDKLLAHELTHTLQQRGQTQKIIQRQAIDEDDEFNKPPQLDTATATSLAAAQVAQSSVNGNKQGQQGLASTPAEQSTGPKQLTLEMILAQPDLKRALATLAKDLGYIVNHPVGTLTPKQEKELKDLGMENRLIDPVAFIAHKFGYKDSVADARKEMVKALKDLPSKAVEGVLKFLLDEAKSALQSDTTGLYGPELSAYEGFPLVGEKEFEMDFISAPELKKYPSLKFIGGTLGGRVQSGQQVAVGFYVEWPKPIKDPSMKAGERRVMERWRIDVLAANGSYQVGLMGLNGWQGFSHYIRPDQSTGKIRFRAPSIPGLYQARLVDSQGVRDTVLFRVARSG